MLYMMFIINFQNILIIFYLNRNLHKLAIVFFQMIHIFNDLC